MKNAKTVALFLLTCFVAFAPPGTIIFSLLLILGLLRSTRLRVACLIALGLLLVVGFVLRKQFRRPVN